MAQWKRQIDEHHDGHGLNDDIVISADEKDPSGGGASHVYQAALDGTVIASVQFQHGPRNELGSIPGATEAVLLAILIDRLRGFQAGPYACRENAIQLTHLEEALMWAREAG